MLDREKILNSTPQKKLIRNFNELQKSTLTEEAALHHKSFYEDMPLSFIIENSRYIFAEPIYGLDFYREAVFGDTEYGTFLKYETEAAKLNDYIITYNDKLHPEVREKYEDLKDLMLEKCDLYPHTMLMASVAANSTGDNMFEAALSDALYKYDKDPSRENSDKIYNIVESNTEPSLFFTYAPYANKVLYEHGDCGLMTCTINKFYSLPTLESYTEEDFMNDLWWDTFTESSLFVNKLKSDIPYQEALGLIGESAKAIYEFVSTNPIDFINDLFTEKVANKSEPVFTEYAVNNLFNDSYMKFNEDKFKESKSKRLTMERVYYNKLSDVLMQESSLVEDPETILSEGYNLHEGEVSLADDIKEVGRRMVENDEGFFTFEAPDVVQVVRMPLDKLNEAKNKVVSKFKSNKVQKDANKDYVKYMKQKEENNKDDEEPEKPKQSVTDKIRSKAQDIEVKEKDVIAKARKAGTDIKTAGKAVAAIPDEVESEIKRVASEWDAADTLKRKKELTKPGYRSKLWKNFSAALQYNAVASIRLSWVPILWMIRHQGKSKDKRVRNELIRELTTEIKICEDKINEAGNAGDHKEKYQLMRYKSEMEGELLRIKTNYKYK